MALKAGQLFFLQSSVYHQSYRPVLWRFSSDWRAFPPSGIAVLCSKQLFPPIGYVPKFSTLVRTLAAGLILFPFTFCPKYGFFVFRMVLLHCVVAPN